MSAPVETVTEWAPDPETGQLRPVVHHYLIGPRGWRRRISNCDLAAMKAGIVDWSPRPEDVANLQAEADRLRARVAELEATVASLVGGAEVRHGRSSTSRVAAASVRLRAGTQKHRLLRAYGACPEGSGLIDWDAACAAGVGEDGAAWWMRCSDLRLAGLIRPNGQTQFSGRTGEECQVCEITPEGRAALSVLESKAHG